MASSQNKGRGANTVVGYFVLLEIRRETSLSFIFPISEANIHLNHIFGDLRSSKNIASSSRTNRTNALGVANFFRSVQLR